MYLINNGEGGQLGNQFMRNFILYFLVKKYNFKCSVKYYLEKDFQKLGLPFFSSDNNIKCEGEEKILINAYKCIQKKTKIEDINLKWGIKYFIHERSYYQSIKYAEFMIYNFHKKNNTLIKRIINNNKFKERYDNNKDIFIHIRSGRLFDRIPPIIPCFEYYDYVINSLDGKYDNIYVCSDNVNNNIIQRLKEKYEVKIPECNNNKLDVILFGSTCKYVVLSSGSFSFMIGLFSYFTKNIYFSSNTGKLGKRMDKRWHPDYYLAMDKTNFDKFIKIDL